MPRPIAARHWPELTSAFRAPVTFAERELAKLSPAADPRGDVGRGLADYSSVRSPLLYWVSRIAAALLP